MALIIEASGSLVKAPVHSILQLAFEFDIVLTGKKEKKKRKKKEAILELNKNKVLHSHSRIHIYFRIVHFTYAVGNKFSSDNIIHVPLEWLAFHVFPEGNALSNASDFNLWEKNQGKCTKAW